MADWYEEDILPDLERVRGSIHYASENCGEPSLKDELWTKDDKAACRRLAKFWTEKLSQEYAGLFIDLIWNGPLHAIEVRTHEPFIIECYEDCFRDTERYAYELPSKPENESGSGIDAVAVAVDEKPLQVWPHEGRGEALLFYASHWQLLGESDYQDEWNAIEQFFNYSGDERLYRHREDESYLLVRQYSHCEASHLEQSTYQWLSRAEAANWILATGNEIPPVLKAEVNSLRKMRTLRPPSLEQQTPAEESPTIARNGEAGEVAEDKAELPSIDKLEQETPALDTEDSQNWIKASELKKHKEPADLKSFDSQRSRGLKTEDKLFGVDEVGRIYRKHGGRIWYYAPSLLPRRDKDQPLISQALTLISTLDLPLIR
ncbi:hypothetical protein [Adhaeretor mobilis]|uniref:Uncharacterized protein n=1 Tax=Adhaeretor mobilis TaxID=1930276 RepID=A0A517MS47_9BACT|nr:hypothetical protein [Adhaeretor mobilis]QDS97701.1 hypothetical protein HG15A2_09650 [Adhaeretor mobilis]